MVVPVVGLVCTEHVRTVRRLPAWLLGRYEMSVGRWLIWRRVIALAVVIADQLGRQALGEIAVFVKAVRISVPALSRRSVPHRSSD
jgi:hypothetical protein